MTVSFTLCTLVVLLVVIISTSYFMNKEGFEDITNASLKSALNTVSPKDVPMDVQQATSNLQNTPSSPKREEIVPQVSVSGSGYEALTLQQRMDLLKDIQKVVRNEILANRSTHPVMNNEMKPEETNSTAQGKEFEKSCDKESEQEYRCPKNPDGSCPPVPDMSQYIKKDAIPCWGCAIDY
jgi:hypothetical protein